MEGIIVAPQEEVGIDAILADFSPETQDVIRERYETQMRIGKASGNEETSAFFEKTFKESLQKVLNAPDLPEDNHERLEYWEDRIRQAKERGSSEAHIAHLERFRDNTIKLIEVLEKNASEFQAERDHLASLSTHEERIAYYEERLPAAEDALRLAKESGDASKIQWAQWDVEAIKSDIKHEERLLADIPKKAELDALLERAAASRARMIDKYRHLLHTEVVDGVEHVVGVRTPDEIASSASEKSEGSSFPEEAPSLVPAVSEDVSSPPPVVENTPIPSFEGMPPQPFVKAET